LARTVYIHRIYTPYMTVCLLIFLPKIPYIHRVYLWFCPTLCISDVRNWMGLLLNECCRRQFILGSPAQVLIVFHIYIDGNLTAMQLQTVLCVCMCASCVCVYVCVWDDSLRVMCDVWCMEGSTINCVCTLWILVISFSKSTCVGYVLHGLCCS